MSVACCVPLVECVSCLACARWVWKKFLYTAGRESETWGLATAAEFEPVPRLCRYILSVYENDLRQPVWAPPGGYGINPDWVVSKKDYSDTAGRVSPYMIYIDHENSDIILLIRGLNLGKESDFLLLLDNKLGQTTYDDGYVHNGLLKAAQYVLEEECGVLGELVGRYSEYSLTFAGHSLGAGVVTLLTMLAVKNREKLGGVERDRIRCFAIAPARCISLNLAVRYADVINSVVLQDDFLPRTTVALEDVYKSLLCFPCLMCIMCLKDTCTLEEKMLQDPRRLYAPGRLYHIIVRKPFRCKRIQPLVRTAVPVDGRFEHIVLSCNITSDHAIIWILQESERAYNAMLEKEHAMNFPRAQKMERQASLVKEHNEEYKAAIERAVALDVPHAYPPLPSYGTFQEMEKGQNSSTLHEDYFVG
ncbi:alpha/beta-Hydrolases superfamily protein [Striga hermonthica]|uniref:Alpha/beta-Hydrolases superfamily protein n=1 Tax=Striga hermonthica TaxID=68872 RepID=A0A9N7P1Q2_STRHE|nr:alpha/beta-Hydrolases superfamily protein [Striga hermonthica]